MRNIADHIKERFEEAFAANGVLESERDLWEIGIVAAFHYADPENRTRDSMLFGALVCFAYPVSGSPTDRIVHWADVKEPYQPQAAYNLQAKKAIEDTLAELTEYLGNPPSGEKKSAGGLLLPVQGIRLPS